MNKIKNIKIGLSIILASLLIVPIISFGATQNKENFSTTNSIDNSSIAVSADKIVPEKYGNPGEVQFEVDINVTAIGALSPSLVPAPGDWWHDWKNYVKFTSLTGIKLNYEMTTDAIDANGNITLKFEANDTQKYTYGYYQMALSKDTIKPSFSANKTTVSTVLASTVTLSNYQQYVNVVDPDKTILTISFGHDDTTGTLILKVTYRGTTDHSDDQIVDHFNDSITGFVIAKTEPPTIAINAKTIQILPSAMNNNNFKNYLDISDPTAIASISSIKADDINGTLAFVANIYKMSTHSPGTPTFPFSYSFDHGFATAIKPLTITKTSHAQEVLPSIVDSSNYKTYLTIDDYYGSLIKNSMKFTHDDSSGELDVSVDYYTSNYKSKGGATKHHSFKIMGFATATITPTLKINTMAISQITEAFFKSLIIVNYPTQTMDQLEGYVSVTNDFDTNRLADVAYAKHSLTISYYKTSYTQSPTKTETITLKIPDFAKDAPWPPKFSLTSEASKALPVTIDGTNYRTYLNVVDPNNTLINNDIHFNGDNYTGKLSISGTYYNTTDRSPSGPTFTYSYIFDGFRIGDIKPVISVKDNVNEILPSYITSANYATYLDVVDEDRSLIPSNMQFTSDDVNGNLTLKGAYYITAVHNNGAPTASYSYDLKGFDFTTPTNNDNNLYIIIGAVCAAIVLLIIIAIVSWIYMTRTSKVTKFWE